MYIKSLILVLKLYFFNKHELKKKFFLIYIYTYIYRYKNYTLIIIKKKIIFFFFFLIFLLI